MRTILNEKAESLPAALVTAIVTSFILLAIGVIIAAVTGLARDTNEDVTDTTEHQLLVTEFTDDVETSFHVTPYSASKIKLSSLTEDGNCADVVWEKTGSTVTRSFTLYSAVTESQTGCDENSELLVTTATKQIVEDSGTFAVSYSNNLNRKMNENGTVFLNSAEAAPEDSKNVREAWEDPQVVTVNLAYSFQDEVGTAGEVKNLTAKKLAK